MRGRHAGGSVAARERSATAFDLSDWPLPLRYGLAVPPIAIVTGLAELFSAFISNASITLGFLVAILFVSVSLGRGPALVSCILAVLALDYFFIEPLYSLSIYSTEDIVTLGFFLVVAVVASGLASRLRQQMLLARRHAGTTASLYAFSRELTGIASLDALFATVAREAAALLGARAVLLSAESERLVSRAAAPDGAELDPQAAAQAERAFRHDRGGVRAASGSWQLVPLRTARGAAGLLAVQPEPVEHAFAAEQLRLLETLAELTSVAVERQLLADELNEIRVNREIARLGSVMLASIAHDLRTPAGAAMSALSALEADRERLDLGQQDELLAIARRETERLNRFIGNLLEMTRLESGGLELRREPVDPADVVGAAVSRAREEFPAHRFAVEIAAELPLIPIDPVLIELALFNLLHNAAKFAPPGLEIRVCVDPASGGGIVIRVLDEGPGIPPDQLERIFEKFYRVRRPATGVLVGTGLGLAISRGFVDAHGGRVTAENRTDRQGAVFTITLPGAAPA